VVTWDPGQPTVVVERHPSYQGQQVSHHPILALASWPNLHQSLNFIYPDLHPSYAASVDGTGGGSKSNRETPPTANLWRGGGTVEVAATSGLAEDGKGTLCTTVAPRVDLLEPGPGGKHGHAGSRGAAGVAS
jgi:hypothetical protein